MPNFAPLVKAGAKGVDYLVDALRTAKAEAPEVFSRSFMDNDMTGLADRVKRVAYAEDLNRLPNLSKVVPQAQIPKEAMGEMVTMYRGVPANIENATIRAGDWVSLNPKHAGIHGTGQTGKNQMLTMQVPAKDVTWAGTDMNEFFYAPQHYKTGQEMALDMLNRMGRKAFE